MVGRIAIGRAQVADQQLLATEVVKRQEAVAILEAEEIPTELLAMHQVIDGVEVEDQALFRRTAKGEDKLLDDPILDRRRSLVADLLLEAAERQLRR